MLVNVGSYGGLSKKLPEFEYTGRYTFTQDGTNWELKLLTSGTLTFKKQNSAKVIDIFAVGKGAPGQSGSGGPWGGGHGGKGGECITKKGVQLKEKSIVVSIESKNTSFGKYVTAVSGKGSGRSKAFGEEAGPYYGSNGSNGKENASITAGLNGASGPANTGQGGNGGNWCWYGGEWQWGYGGDGGTGILILRNARA